MTDERGSVTLWLLGLSVGVLFLGGVSLDLWRGFSERRALAGIADAAAIAGSTALDEARYRSAGVAELDVAAAEQRALSHLAAQADTRALTAARVVASPTDIVVSLDGEVDLTLLRLLAPDQPALRINVTARSAPALLPPGTGGTP